MSEVAFSTANPSVAFEVSPSINLAAGGVVPEGTNYAVIPWQIMDDVSHANYDTKWQRQNGILPRTQPYANPEFIQDVDPDIGFGMDTLKYDNAFGNKRRFTNLNGDYFLPGIWADNYVQNRDFVNKDGVPYNYDWATARQESDSGGYSISVGAGSKSINFWVDHLFGVCAGNLQGGVIETFDIDAAGLVNSDILGDGVGFYPAPMILLSSAVLPKSLQLGDVYTWTSGYGAFHSGYHVGRCGDLYHTSGVGTPFSYSWHRDGKHWQSTTLSSVAMLVWRPLNLAHLNI